MAVISWVPLIVVLLGCEYTSLLIRLLELIADVSEDLLLCVIRVSGTNIYTSQQ